MPYADLATLKLALGITDNARDVLLTQALKAASAGIEERCGRRFAREETATARMFRTRGRAVRLPDGGELLIVDDIATDAGLIVEVGDGTSWAALAPFDYETAPDNALAESRPVTGLVRPYARWSAARQVRVTAVWGWPAVPDAIVQAVLLQAARLYRRKDSPEGVAGSAEWGLVRVPRLDPDVLALLEPFRLPGFG